MRRKEREVIDRDQIESILKECRIMHLGIHDDPYPYVVPLNYGYQYNDEGMILYFHSAKQGRKIELLEANPMVAFTIDGLYELVPHQIACKNTLLYKSIMGNGKIEFVKEEFEKLEALKLIMTHQTGQEGDYSSSAVKEVMVIRINVIDYCGKINR